MEPTLAEQARTAVAQAKVGTLTTYGRRTALAPRCTVVGVIGDGTSVLVHLRPESPAAADLLARPLATITVGPPGLAQVALQGGAARLPGRDERGRLAFRVEPGAVRVGERPSPVPVTDYLRADPDPLAAVAPALLDHLASHHVPDLTACVRTRGVPATWAEPVRLDRHGLGLTALHADGVTSLRLDFPHPVASLDELPAGLRALLCCRCSA